MEEAQPTPSLYGQVDGQRGAGGKLRKPPARKSSQATPYDRPPSNQHGRCGWLLSKLVDPACRLVASGATKIFPSFFSSAAALPPPTENLDEEAVEVTPGAEGDETLSHDAPEIHNTPELNEISRSSDVAAHRDSKSEELVQDEPNSIKNDSHLSGIEMLLKGKTFSRDEISRLTEILNSRVSDASDVDARKKKEVRTIVRGNIGDLHTPFSKASNDGNQKDPKKVPIPSSTPVLDIVPDKIVASPIEIARAYMGSRISEYGPGPYGAPSKGETAQRLNDEFASKALIPSSAPRLTCWPGAMAQEHGYATPNQRSRQGLHDFPRTPYSRTIYSKSRAKVQADSDPFKQFQAPTLAEVKYRNDVLDISYGSVGPICRVRMKYGSDDRPGGSIFSKSSRDAPSVIQKPVVSENNQPYLQKNLQRGEASNSKQQPAFPVGNRPGSQPVLNRSASEAVKKILDQLDTHKPTTQEKIEELKLAGAWRKPPTEGSSATLKESISISNSKELVPLSKTNLLDSKVIPKGNKCGGHSKSQGDSLERSIDAKEAVAASSKASSIVDADPVMKNDVNTGFPFSFKSTSSQPKSFQEKEDQDVPPKSGIFGQPATTTSNDFKFEPLKKPSLHLSGTRPNLAHIAVRRCDPNGSVSSENSAGFSFPALTSSSTLSEPPTPSIMPFSSSGVASQPKDATAVPAYSFGNEKSTPRLVFSFPSTSNAPSHVDTHDIKFSFGSDKKARLSFGSVGKDAICCRKWQLYPGYNSGTIIISSE